MSPRLEVPSDRDRSGRSLGDEELGRLAEVIRSGSLNANSGRMVHRFEDEFARALGVRGSVACSSGSLAVQAALAAARLDSGSEVVTSPVTDFGAITAILYEGLVPVFCDVDPATLMPTAETVEAAIGPRCSAVVATHLFGRPAPVAAIRAVAARRGILLVEDAAQALGSLHGTRPAGTFGQLGTFSFQQSKHITCGEGGAVVTDDPVLLRRVRLFVNKGWPYGEPDPDHLCVAPNGRMTELQAAVLVAQLPKLPSLVARRRASAQAMLAELDGAGSLRFPAVPAGDRHSFWRIALVAGKGVDVVGLARALGDEGIPSQGRYVGRAAFELEALRGRGLAADLDAFPGVRDGLRRCLVVGWNEGIDPPLGRAIGRRVAACAGGLERG